MERSLTISKRFKFFVTPAFLSLFLLAGVAGAQDCPVPSRTVDVGGVAIGVDDVAAVKDRLSGRSHSADRDYATAGPGVAVGQSLVAEADVRAIRDIVAGNAEFSAFGIDRAGTETVSVGLAEVSRDEFSGVKAGVGKISPASTTSRDCA